MRLITHDKDDYFAIPVNRIDWIKLEDAAGGKYFLKIGAGGQTHIFNFDQRAPAYDYYDAVKKSIEEL